METCTIELGHVQMLLGLLPVAAAVLLSYVYQLGLTKPIAWGVVRAALQMTVMGFVLVWIFKQNDPWLISAMFVFMVGAASQAACGRLKKSAHSVKARRVLQRILFLSIFAGSLITLGYLQFVVVRTDPVWEARYLVPLAGMIISNSMNAAALALERFRTELTLRAGEVEAYLALGATAKEASLSAVRTAVAAAMMPSVNGLAVLGLVSLPGMMSGQILAGVSPLLAIRYQLLVNFTITAAAAIVSFAAVMLARRTYFTKDERFISPALFDD